VGRVVTAVRHGARVLLAHESSIVRAGLATFLGLEIIPQKVDSYLINKENVVPGRGLEPEEFSNDIQRVRKPLLLFTRQITRYRLLV